MINKNPVPSIERNLNFEHLKVVTE